MPGFPDYYWELKYCIWNGMWAICQLNLTDWCVWRHKYLFASYFKHSVSSTLIFTMQSLLCKCRGGRRHLSMNLVGGWLYFCKCFKTFSVALMITQQVFTGKVCKTFLAFTATRDSHQHTLYTNENRIMLRFGWCLTTLCNTQSLSFHCSTVGMEVDIKW